MDQQWEQLRQRCLACRACSLAQERTQVVFGVGDPAAEVLLVGEAPGANEDKQGEPFVGRAGKLLDDMLQMIGLSRERIYITNSVKCRPPQNRDPLNTEKEACSGYLRRQMELMQPKILVCLGRIMISIFIFCKFFFNFPFFNCLTHKVYPSSILWCKIHSIRFCGRIVTVYETL